MIKTGVILLSTFCFLFTVVSADALTLRELLEKPLPNVSAFMAKVWDWLNWLWAKIVAIVNLILDWTLDNILAYIWKILVWAWNLIKTTFMEAWNAFLYFWGLIKDNDFVDWENIAWPWD
jgi:hypothetical protein